MNFLQLVNSAREKCGINGSALPSVLGQTGESLRMINWVADSWVDIQERHDNWLFMQTSFSLGTVNQKQAYTASDANIVNLGNWKRNSLRIYQTSIGVISETWLPFLDYEEFRNRYQFGAMRGNYNKPVVYSIDPAKRLLLGPCPNAVGYTVQGEYFTAPVELAANADIPAMPTQFHRAIVCRAMMFYGAYEAAGEVYQQGQIEFKTLLANLENDQLPPVDLGGPLC